MLIDKVNKIFLDNCYSVVPVSHELSGYEVFIAVPNNKKRQEFFLLLEHKSPSDEILKSLIKKDADVLFNLLSASEHSDETFRKNCTMILCCESVNILPDCILAVEEDPYNFKKNVITYNQAELQSWENKIVDSLSVNALNDLINGEKGELFRRFKEENRSNDYYSLLMKIVTKIPIIHYMTTEKDLYDLDAEIKKNLTGNDREIHDFIIGIDLGKSEEDIEKILLGDWTINHE